MNNENQISRPYIDINSHDQFFSCIWYLLEEEKSLRKKYFLLLRFLVIGNVKKKASLLALRTLATLLVCTTTRLGVPKDFASRKGWSQLLVGLGHSLDCMAAHHGLGKLRGSYCIQRPLGVGKGKQNKTETCVFKKDIFFYINTKMLPIATMIKACLSIWFLYDIIL